MNELISLAEVAASTLTHLLKTEIGEKFMVVNLGGQILIKISQSDFEQRLGNLLQKIYITIDKKIPSRKEHLSIIISDTNARYESVFKIWKSV